MLVDADGDCDSGMCDNENVVTELIVWLFGSPRASKHQRKFDSADYWGRVLLLICWLNADLDDDSKDRQQMKYI